MTTSERQAHRAYVLGLKAQIKPESLTRAIAHLRKRERIRAAKTFGKTLSTLAGVGLGTALVISLVRTRRAPPPVLAKK
jgi:hypothetical protein